ncbi:MAG: class II glutamine amidotransferase [bacterium]|nr:class II glutamine amidotransferase [bacterium]
MCRLLAVIDTKDKPRTLKALREFRDLAEYGRISKGWSIGHKDGWGLVGYGKGRIVAFEKYPNDAFYDMRYETATAKLLKKKPKVVIGHLRKAAVGTNTMENTHPFRHGNISLCHNGVVIDYKKLPLKPRFKKLIRGTTDTEPFFAYVLQLFHERGGSTKLTTSGKNKENFRAALLDAIQFVHKNCDYTAMNLIVSDGRMLYILFDANTKNAMVKKRRLEGYYGPYKGFDKKGKLILVVSEKLPIKDITWKPFRNREMLEVDMYV